MNSQSEKAEAFRAYHEEPGAFDRQAGIRRDHVQAVHELRMHDRRHREAGLRCS
jgi:hypothetical protein